MKFLALSFLSLFLANAAWAQSLAPSTVQPVDPATAPLSPNAPVQSAPAQMPPMGMPGIPGTPGGSMADGADDIRDIRTVALEPPFNWTLWISIGVVVLVLVVALVVYLIMRGRKPPLLPHEKALLGLEEARGEAKPGEGREYAYTVSEIVRQYIEQRFNVSATQNTTEEFLAELLENPNGSLAGYTTELEEFMSGCDLVKFAAMELDQEGIDQFHGTALGFVRATAPKKEGQQAAAAETLAPAPPSATAEATEPAAEASTTEAAPVEEATANPALEAATPAEPKSAVSPASSFVQQSEPQAKTEEEPKPEAPATPAAPAESEEHPDSKYLPK